MSKLQKLGVEMMGVGWPTCLALSAGGVGAVSILSGFLSNAARQLSFNLNNPLLFLWFLVLYGLPAAIGIGIIAAILKGLLYVSGRGLLGFGVRLSHKVPMPDISIPVRRSESKALFRAIERKIDQRSKDLKRAGLGVEKRVSKDSHYSYRFSYKAHLVYHFSMMPRLDEGPNSVGFLDGWSEPQPDTYTAIGTIRATLGNHKSMLYLTNLSLLDQNGLPIRSGLFDYNDLAERIWAKASKIIESRMKQGSNAA